MRGDVLELLAAHQRRPMIDEAVPCFRLDLSPGSVDVAEYPIDGEVRVDSVVLLAKVEGEVRFDGFSHTAPEARVSVVRLPANPRPRD